MRHHPLAVALIAILAGGCSPTPAPSSTPPSLSAAPVDAAKNEAALEIPDLPEIQPRLFASWPSVTEKPVQIGPRDWTICASGPPPEWERERHAAEEASGLHASYSIIVRVSPNAAASFREGGTLPEGAVVVKEKHKINDLNGKSTFDAYAFMIKRKAGYDPANGDWEYAFVTLQPKRTVTRGRLAECSKCHAKASEHDYLFRLYLADGK